jgi:uncharacterized membrane protein
MNEKLRALFTRHKYKIGVFLLLNTASAICISLVVARMVYSGSSNYLNLVWNLFLAWIPFVLAYLAYIFSWRRVLIFLSIPTFAFLWLIFFPNAPYILTDLQHLSNRAGDVPIWYDVILLIWFSWTGMLMGVVSLYLMHEIIKRELGRFLGWVFVILMAGLTGAGIYIGRFVRLNSWDILQSPAAAVEDLWSWLSDPSLRSIGFIALYTLFFVFVYLTLYAFGHILLEQAHKN